MAHVVEIWEMVSEGRVRRMASCLSCGWCGTSGSMLQAEAEAHEHEVGEMQVRRVGEASVVHRPPGDGPVG